MSYRTRNSQVFRSLLEKGVETNLKDMLTAWCKQVATDFVKYIDEEVFAPRGEGNEDFPIYSENLHDATGVGVYCDSVLTSYVPTKQAKHAQHIGGQGPIWGHERLTAAIQSGVSEYGSGVWIVLFSSVPYAAIVNDIGSPKFRGQNYFHKLSIDMANRLLNDFQPITL